MRDKTISERSSRTPNYRTVRFEKREAAGGGVGVPPAISLKTKLLHARMAIFRER